ncbi:hypothetical protein H311_04453, partial [Anncaliia algerae PRA109]
VANDSRILTNEYRSYSNLNNFNFVHHSVFHKYEFIYSLNGVNTQAVESFNNCLKLKLKRKRRKRK